MGVPVDVHEAVSSAVSSTLGLADAPFDANFFELGGDSLSALEVTAVLQERLGRELDVELLYECDTLAEYARLVDVARRV